MEVIIDGLFELLSGIVNFSNTLIDHWIPLATLIAVIFGFYKFNKHTKKLERVQIYTEFRIFYEKLELSSRIDRLISYMENKSEYIDIYIKYSKACNLKTGTTVTTREFEKIFTEDFMYFIKELHECICLVNELYYYMKDFDLLSIKYTAIYQLDIFKLDLKFMKYMSAHLKYEKGGEQFNDFRFFRFENLIEGYVEVYKLHLEHRIRFTKS